jgi:lysyl-tRNA synthetase class I
MILKATKRGREGSKIYNLEAFQVDQSQNMISSVDVDPSQLFIYSYNTMATTREMSSEKGKQVTAVEAKEMTMTNLGGMSFDQNKPSSVVEFFIKMGVDKYYSSFFSRIW